jgi:glutamine synthetase
VPGYEAPVYLCWAKKNRSALIRIPQINESQPQAARAEIRCADALCNPYLACTFLIQTSLAGIINNEQAPAAIEVNLFKLTAQQITDLHITTLPTSLGQALANFQSSNEMRNIFNLTLVNELSSMKRKENLQFNKAVTDWELHRYL